jgi:hypothetical protein
MELVELINKYVFLTKLAAFAPVDGHTAPRMR